MGGVDLEKIKAMVTWSQPKTVKALRGFLELTVYYIKFIKHYGVIAEPIIDLTKKENFFWTDPVEQTFSILKQAMVSALVLHLSNF